VTDASRVDRLAAHRQLSDVPRAQLEWLAQHGEVRRMPTGAVLGQRTWLVQELVVVLSGHLSIRVDRGGGPRRVAEWTGGDITGLFFSRLATPPGEHDRGRGCRDPGAEARVLRGDRSGVATMTAMTVHVMLDRARRCQRVTTGREDDLARAAVRRARAS
jgi:hypothetical protein